MLYIVKGKGVCKLKKTIILALVVMVVLVTAVVTFLVKAAEGTPTRVPYMQATTDEPIETIDKKDK